MKKTVITIAVALTMIATGPTAYADEEVVESEPVVVEPTPTPTPVPETHCHEPGGIPLSQMPSPHTHSRSDECHFHANPPYRNDYPEGYVHWERPNYVYTPPTQVYVPITYVYTQPQIQTPQTSPITEMLQMLFLFNQMGRPTQQMYMPTQDLQQPVDPTLNNLYSQQRNVSTANITQREAKAAKLSKKKKKKGKRRSSR